MKEVWKPVRGYESLYSVSNLGRVRSHHRSKERILKPTANSYGYLQVGLSKDGECRKHQVHRLVLEAFVGPRPGPPRLNPVNHIDGDKENNCLENIEWSTPGVNNVHAIHNGLRDYALNLELAEEIRRLYAAGGVTYRGLARDYGVTYGTIGAVVRGERWVPLAA